MGASDKKTNLEILEEMNALATSAPWEASQPYNFSGTLVSYIGTDRKNAILQTRYSDTKMQEAEATSQFVATSRNVFSAMSAIVRAAQHLRSSVGDGVYEAEHDLDMKLAAFESIKIRK